VEKKETAAVASAQRTDRGCIGLCRTSRFFDRNDGLVLAASILYSQLGVICCTRLSIAGLAKDGGYLASIIRHAHQRYRRALTEAEVRGFGGQHPVAVHDT